MNTVSVGLPVFNGENFLAEAIASVQRQTFEDWELVICDNASSDGTQSIGEQAAAGDRRIRYHRNPENLGAAPNYNRTWQLSSGVYFKWLAHDDRIKPGYLAAAVAALDAAPDAVLCNAVADYIDSQGKAFEVYDSELRLASLDDPIKRFAAMLLRSHSCIDFFGLCRRTAMQDSLLHGSFHGADRAFLAQMALRGRLLQIDEKLVEMREHDMRYTRQQQKTEGRQAWHNAAHKTRRQFPTWRLYGELWKLVAKERLNTKDRLRAAGVLLRWLTVNYNSVRLGVDVVSVVAPGLPARAEAVKKRLFGAAPGHFEK